MEDYVVARDIEQALQKAQSKTGKKLKISDLKQDKDCLDTWFSSWLWPISVFDGMESPDNEEFKYYYPTNDLVTAPDIIFFWVARMIFAGFEFKSEKPFSNVYFTGLVRDKKRHKMSKSLGNSPDPIALIKKYGADGVRVGLLLSTSAGNDLLFDEELCEQGRNFASKIWNAFRLIKGFEVKDIAQPEACKIGIAWYKNKFQKQLKSIEKSFENYRISEALMALYKLVWEDFCAWFLEIVKPSYSRPIDVVTYKKTIVFLEENLKLLHPFMPFLTEEIWQHITERSPENAMIVADYPVQKDFDEVLIKDFEFAQEIISNVRKIRKDKNISFKKALDLYVLNSENKSDVFDDIIKKLCHIETLEIIEQSVQNTISFRVKSNEYFIPISGNIDITAQKQKLLEELKYAEGFLKSVEKKLSNERFIQNAPQRIIAHEQKKQTDARAKIQTLKASLEEL